MKVKRNTPCPCGSDKLYKKCCANVKKEDRVFNDELVHFVLNNNSIELLYFISYLQLMPENHSKIVRLEKIQHKIIENLHHNFTNKKIDFKNLKSILDKNYSYDMNEDPSESCFSENIMFFNGNNIVFPGIAHNCTETNQLILNSIFLNQNNLPERCKKEIEEGIFLNLYIHNKIAEKLNIKRYEYIEDYRGKIKFPNNINIDNCPNLLKISKKEIEKLIRQNQLKYNILKDISIDYKDVKRRSIDDSNLIRKPFIVFNNDYYLALPSAQMFSLNIFLHNKINEFNSLDEFKKTFFEVIKLEGDLVLKKLGWKISNVYQKLVDFDADIWQFDTNKFAIVLYVLQTTETKSTYNKLNDFVKANKGDNHFIAMAITSNYYLEFPSTTSQQKLKNLDYQMMISLLDLKRISILWNLKSLDIWNYLRAKERAEKRGLTIAPFFSILTYFTYYKKNECSFFNSDDAKPDFISFTFDMQGDKVIESLQKEDRHLVQYIEKTGGYGYLPVNSYDTIPHAPLYFADTVFNGEMKIVLEKYNFPIWITSYKSYDLETKSFIDAVAYWLNEFYPTLNPKLFNIPNIPINIELSIELPNNLNIDKVSKNNDVIFDSSIDKTLNKIEIIIPSSIHNLIRQDNNYGEKILMGFILERLFDLMKINFDINIKKDLVSNVLKQHMPLSMAKMIIAGTTLDDIKLDNTNLDSNVKRLNKADTSIVLEDMLQWTGKKVPEKINTKKEKIELCVNAINTLINKIKSTLSEFNAVELLKLVILRNETLLNDSAFKQLRAVTYYECFKTHTDAVNEYIEEDSKNIRTALAIRGLIEFIVAEPGYGSKRPNNSDIDFLVALMDELTFLGTTKDLISFDLDNPEMGKLPSGRLGIKKDYFDKIMDFSSEIKKDEHYEYIEKYNNHLSEENRSEEEIDKYYNKIGQTFEKEFGLNFFKIKALMYELAQFCLENESSYLVYNDDELINLLQQEFNLKSIEINSFLKHFTLNSRGNIGTPPKDYDYPEIYPWRFNRRLSFLSKPVIRIKDENEVYKNILSARHLVSSADNFITLFFNGSLKISPEMNEINSLLAQRNNIKGKEFRNEVCNWLKINTNLEVVPYEFKIPVKGNDKNFGDVDILAFDKVNKIIYSIECKNTKQAKIIYEFQRDAKNYINKQLPKHFSRTEWLKNNLDFLSNRFKYDFSTFKINSLLISSYQLPIKLIQQVDKITIASFPEIKRKHFFK